MTVVIAGCGDVGTEAGLRFLAAGHPVLGLRRSAHVLPASFQSRSVDLARETPALPSDTDIVVLATSASGRSEAAYRSAYVQTAEAMVRAILRDCSLPPRVLMVSSTSVWGIDDGSRIDEDVPAIPSSPTAAVLLQAEQVLRDSLPDVVVLRLGGIYGPGRGRMIDQARRGAATQSGGQHFTNRIHRDDAAAAIVHLSTASPSSQQVFLGVDDMPTHREEVLQFIAAELGIDRPVGSPDTHGPRSGKQCDNTKLRQSGFTFAFPSYREGYRAILNGQGIRHR